jgi:large repetitive protein
MTVPKPTLSVSGTFSGAIGGVVPIQIILVDPSGFASGTISLIEGSSNLGTVPVTNGSASFVLRGLASGSHSIVARFSGNTPVDDLVLPAILITKASTETRLLATPVTGTNLVTAVQAVVGFNGSVGTGTVVVQEDSHQVALVTLGGGATANIPVTGLPTGTHTLTAAYSGDANNEYSISQALTIQVGPLPTTTKILSVSPAAAQTGQPVDITVGVSAGAGTPSGSVALLDSGVSIASATLGPLGTAVLHLTSLTAGMHSLSAKFQGSAGFAPSASTTASLSVTQLEFVVINAASGKALLSAGSFASGFGQNLTGIDRMAALTLVASKGVGYVLPLIFSSATQVNFLIPSALATGNAKLTLTSANGTFTAAITISPFAPALFSADSSGSGAAAAFLILVHADGSQTITPIFECGPAACKTAPVSLGTESDIAELSFYGSGFDKADGLQVQMGTADLIPDYAGPQGQFPGLDQLNVRVPKTAQGLQQITVSLGGVVSNALSVEFP